MRYKWLLTLAAAGALLAQAAPAFSGDSSADLPKGVKDLDVGALWYISYQYGESGGDHPNKFVVKRGYIDITKKMAPWLEARVTPDVYMDSTGDAKVRLKYIYAKFKSAADGALYKPWLEFGQVHMPWLDFEEHVNYYRLQDTMMSERNKNFNSSDFGLTAGGLLGGEMPDEYKKTVNDKYAGRYGSFAAGVYNGGGYHAQEMNENKAVEGRLTVRPVPDQIPGLQVSYFGVYGEGNVAPTDEMDPPDWRFNLGMVSYEHKRVTLTGTYLKATGNQSGTAVDAAGEAVCQSGYSLFGEFKIPEQKSSVIGRWDHYDPNDDVKNDAQDRLIVGYAYHLPMGSMVLVDYEHLSFENDSIDSDWRLQTTVQIHYP
jgi:hypothetical protein